MLFFAVQILADNSEHLDEAFARSLVLVDPRLLRDRPELPDAFLHELALSWAQILPCPGDSDRAALVGDHNLVREFNVHDATDDAQDVTEVPGADRHMAPMATVSC